MKKISIVLSILVVSSFCLAQNVPILGYSVNNFGQVQLEIEAHVDEYYILTAQHEPDLNYESITSITMGIDGNMMISEPLSAYQLQNYKITAHSISSPDDTDGDGIDDIVEFDNMPFLAPLNFANEVPFIDGANSIDKHETFSELAVIDDNIPWAPFLNNQEFTKFAILNQDSDEPEVYFINSKTHYIHANFLATINTSGADIVTGEIVYNPNIILPNGAFGSYSFNYSFGSSYSFEHTRRTFELLAVNMPYMNNNLLHFIGSSGEINYENIKDDFIDSRITVVLESEFFADVDFLPFNQAEGFGFFRLMELDEHPGSRDIVLYNALPNSLPRVGGIITSVVQTPLSHVNLRAIQDNVPNAYIKDPLEIDSISNLLGSYIYYRVEEDKYFIREASLEEVNDWYENIRPTEAQIPKRDLSQTDILPLDSIEFEMAVAFGAKCSNVATMRTFGMPDGTIPNGFGVPFYFYDKFMKFNGFYKDIESMLSDSEFINDLDTRIEMLKDFRKEIRAADMPQWMLDELQMMHNAFPSGSSVRCRSSTNNEDLPGFSGAGLYTSKTQHPDEGHISKSIKQVYASMWNFRAFDERDFYRVDHYVAAMGILCHPNYTDEKSNGVGVSLDPIYNTENTFYLNTQVGESLITNPDENAIPEEMLLSEDPDGGYFILRRSNLVDEGELVMEEEYLDLLRSDLKLIHDEFAILYNVVGAEGFGMDIEYKVTAEDQLIIKQARPWVSFWADIKANYDLAVVEITYPQNSSSIGDEELVVVNIGNKGLEEMDSFAISLFKEGQFVEKLEISDKLTPQTSAEFQFTIPLDFSTLGDHNLGVVVSHLSDGYSGNDTLDIVVSKLHYLDGGISIVKGNVKCGDVIDVLSKVTNYGEATFVTTEIEVLVNGIVVDTVIYDFNIPYLAEVDIEITITENLQQVNNEIILNLLRLNGTEDVIHDNNSSSLIIDLNSDDDFITLVINTDNYPIETSWGLYDELNNEVVASGNLSDFDQVVIEDICVDYSSCYSLKVYDSFGDGICCQWGNGNYYILNSLGETIVFNDGMFDFVSEEIFCIGDACFFSAGVSTTSASDQDVADGIITIIPTGELAPYMYSIDGGLSFVNDNTFLDLPAGDYMIVVKESLEICTYEESILLEYDIVDKIDNEEINISIFPNPTLGDFVIEMNNISGEVKIEVIDHLGRLIESDVISNEDDQSTAVISLKGYAPGSYIAKCYHQDFEKNFKIIKL